jgi:DNA polymerase I-like protein with 3'-5' exonuclease and polymerase domains/septum formation inhibitor MinC
MSDHFKERLIQAFHSSLLQGESYSRIHQARSHAAAILNQPILPGNPLTKLVDEAMEAAIVRVAPALIARSATTHQAYDQLVDLLNRQPVLGVRSSTSVLQQAYSTPIPIAYLASTLAGITPKTTVYEPTAGNGALLIAANPANVIANELNRDRFAELEKRGYRQLTQKDASHYRPNEQVDVVITNPPFGVVHGEDGSVKRFTIPGNRRGTRQIDHAIAFRALECLKENGQAVLILGGKLGEDEDLRSNRYNSIESRGFFYALYQQYNVTQHFSVWGDLYRKQGAGFPIDILVIQGREPSQRDLPAADVPTIYKSFDALKERLPDEPIHSRTDHRPGLQQLPLHLEAPGGRRSSLVSSQSSSGSNRIELAGLSTPGDAQNSMDDAQVDGRERRGSSTDSPQTRSSPQDVVYAGTTGSLRGLPNEGIGTPVVVDTGVGRNLHQAQRNLRNEVSTDQRVNLSNFNPSDRLRNTTGVDGGAQHRHPGKLAFRLNLRDVRVIPDPNAAYRIQTMAIVDVEHPPMDAPLNVAYLPRSQGKSPGTLIPANMATAAQSALDKLENAVGDVDEFVRQRMGYESKAQLWKYLYAEQIDANALAFWQRDHSKVFLNGDQTGNGKGRFCASQIVDTINQGYIPVFVTQKPTLYVSMLADLQDIGKLGIRIFATDSHLKLELPDGSKLRTGNPSQQQEEMQCLLHEMGNYQAIFTTYSQLQTIDSGKEPFRRDFLRTIAPRAIFIFDEAHEAGGSTGEKGWTRSSAAPNRSEFARELIDRSAGAVFASATAIKDPAVMDLYARRSDAADAVTNLSSLQRTLKEGGVPLQQMMAAKFVASGQMLRRERSFEGVSFQANVVPVDRQVADDISAIMRAISQFDLAKEKAVAKLSKELKKEAKAASEDSSIGQAGAKSTNFTSLMNNAIDQGLLCQKAEATVQVAIAAIEKGQKPVIAIANTMDAFIGQYAEDQGLQPGDPINISFGDVLSRYLERSRDVTIKDHEGNATRRRMADDELGDTALAAYDNAREIIDSTDLSAIPLSSIDYIKWRLSQAGFRVDEITGRHNIIDYSPAGEQGYARRPISETKPQARVELVDQFNAGDLDVLILNRAGATGINLHASEKFADQKQRHLIMAQAERDINQVMQMLGRVNRFGQVCEPEITLLMSDIPAEKRLGALLSHKMATLNANTTADRDSALSVSSVVDFLTPYGEEVINEILDDQPELEAKLAYPREKLQGDSDIEVISRTTGRIPLLSIKEQEELYTLIESETLDLLVQKQAMGESVLEAQQLDLDAQVIGRMEVIPDDAPVHNEFTGPVYLDVVDAKVPVKPFTQLEVINLVRENLNLESVQHTDDHNFNQVKKLAKEQAQQTIKALQQETQKYRAEILSFKYDSYSKDKATERINQQMLHVSEILRNFPPGEMVRVVSPEGNVTYGVVAKVWQKGHNGSPAAPSNWRAQILTDNQARMLTVPLTRFNRGKEGMLTTISRQDTNWEGQDIYAAFDLKQKAERTERQIFHGNLLKAYEQYPTGKFLNYTDHQGNVRQGLVMPASFDIQESLREKPVVFREPHQVKAFLTELTHHQGAVKTLDEVLTVKTQLATCFGSREATGFVLQTPKSAIGDQFSLDQDLITLAGSEFYSVSDRTELVVPAERIEQILHMLMREKGYTLAAFDFKDQAREYLGVKLPQLQPMKDDAATAPTIDDRNGASSAHAHVEALPKTTIIESLYASAEQLKSIRQDIQEIVSLGHTSTESTIEVAETTIEVAEVALRVGDVDKREEVGEINLPEQTNSDEFNIQQPLERKQPEPSTQSESEVLPKLDIRLVTTIDQLQETVDLYRDAKVLAIDTETTGLDPHCDRVRLIQLAAAACPVTVIDCAALSQDNLKPLTALFEGEAEKVFQNAKFDLQMLKATGLEVKGQLFDTMIASQLIEAGLDQSHKLETIAQRYLEIELDKSEQKSNWEGGLTQNQINYAAQDVAVLLPLREALATQLTQKELNQTAAIEFRAIHGVAEMEWNGMSINREKLHAFADELRQQKVQLGHELGEMLPKPETVQGLLLEATPQNVDLESPKQLLTALKQMGIPINNTRKETLIPLQDQYPILGKLLEYRRATKALSTYAEGYEALIHPITGRLHPNLNQCGAVTGRFSCDKPNLQNVPRDKRIKGCFEPQPGHVLVKADYSQIELRIAAKMSGEPRMNQAYQSGQDLHTLTASYLLHKPLNEITGDERRLAKAVNFGLIYGMQAIGFQSYARTNYGVSLSLPKAEQHREQFFKTYPGLIDWHEQVKQEHADSCRTLGGRLRQWDEKAPFTEMINAPVQGTSADITKLAIANFQESRNSLPQSLDARLLMQVHDEIVIEVPEAQAERAGQLLVQTMLEAGQHFLGEMPVEVEAVICEDWSGKNGRPVPPLTPHESIEVNPHVLPTDVTSQTTPDAELVKAAESIRNLDLQAIATNLGLERDRTHKSKWIAWAQVGGHREKQHIISINDNKFMDWKTEQGGVGAISLTMAVKACDFKSAVEWLCQQKEQNSIPVQVFPESKAPKNLQLPVPHKAHWEQVRQYLTETRALCASWVDKLHHQELIYADDRCNVVFLRQTFQNPDTWDRVGTTGATLRGTAGDFKGLAPGSSKDNGWFWIGVGKGKVQQVVVTESPIDAISLAILEKGQRNQGRIIYLSTDGKGSIPTQALQSVTDRGGGVTAAFDADPDGRKLAEKLITAVPNAEYLMPARGKDWNEQLLSVRQELRDWYRQARDIGRSETHLCRIEQIGKAFTLNGTPLSERDLQAMEQDQRAWQQQVQKVADCARSILDQAGEPQAGGTLFQGKKYILFARDDLLYALAPERGIPPTDDDRKTLPDPVLKSEPGIILKVIQGEMATYATRVTSADVQRFERFAELVSRRFCEQQHER